MVALKWRGILRRVPVGRGAHARAEVWVSVRRGEARASSMTRAVAPSSNDHHLGALGELSVALGARELVDGVAPRVTRTLPGRSGRWRRAPGPADEVAGGVGLVGLPGSQRAKEPRSLAGDEPGTAAVTPVGRAPTAAAR